MGKYFYNHERLDMHRCLLYWKRNQPKTDKIYNF